LSNLIELYIAFFNRVPDADGMSYWIDQIKAGMTVDQMSSSFYDAAIQYSNVTGYSASMSNADFVKVIYKNVLGRDGTLAPPDADVNYWAGELASGKSTKGALIGTMLTSARAYVNDPQWGWVTKLLDNKITVGNFIAIQQGVTYNTPEESITNGMAIALAVTDKDTKAAIAKIGITDSAFNLTTAAPMPQVTVNTSAGNIVIELDTVNAPITSTNFLRYTDVGFYSNKIFHRVISNFMIQGGGFNSDLVQASTYSPIKLEVNKGLSNVRGTIAMARTSVLDSATSQFFINVVDNVFLDTSGGGYAVFGKVISGMDVVDKIKVVPTSTRGAFGDVPVNTVLINSVTRSN
jgi:cyclophilin family peptidyl-prolyl cis-trans isomerase